MTTMTDQTAQDKARRIEELANVPEREAELEELLAARDREIAELRHTLEHDELTGMLNRNGFFKSVENWMADGVKSLTVGLADLDDFKTINDTRGHAAGDEILIDFGARLTEIAEAHNGFAARLSGDEFVIACPGEVPCIAADVLNNVTCCSVSIGLAVGQTRTMRRLLWAADVAMYHSKHKEPEEGSSYTVWEPGTKLPEPTHKRDRRDRDRAAHRKPRGISQTNADRLVRVVKEFNAT